MKIIEEINNKDPEGKWIEYEPRPRSADAARATISKLRRIAAQDKSTIEDMCYRIRSINTYTFNE